ncbi:hypothetical protein QBC46DRAFT_416666 [Diplogelasinospora grovesii]|uniref:Uncharacterized protein n=1 Tax=Diplogelasinospora grovesii TaxID=303347 RepID=A0AAN6N136_9PEZI|nr:hypothetical protein QBC46DRAFT_416666 [Diplogelasinospora grovesii]
MAPQKFEIVLNDVNSEDAQFRLNNERDENNQPVPNRRLVTGYDDHRSKMRLLGEMPIVVHSTPRSTKPGYTLIVFEWNTQRLTLDARFRHVVITVCFTAKDPGRANPEVIKIAPSGESRYNLTRHRVSETSKRVVGGPVSVGAPGVSVSVGGVQYQWERSDVADVTDSITINGHLSTGGKSEPRCHTVEWSMEENTSQRSGVPAMLRTAVLLRRKACDDGHFQATVKAECTTSPAQDFVRKLRDLAGMLPRDEPLHFDPTVNEPAEPAFPQDQLTKVDLAGEFRFNAMTPLPAAAAGTGSGGAA